MQKILLCTPVVISGAIARSIHYRCNEVVVSLATNKLLGLLYITHRLDEVRRLGDRVTVLRDGAIIATHPIGDVSDYQLIQQMVGRRMDRLASGPELLQQGRPSEHKRSASSGSCPRSR